MLILWQLTGKLLKQVIDQNIPTLSNYLEDIGQTNGVNEFVNNKRVRKWIEDGSHDEDYNWMALLDPLYSHFYNPITNTSGVGSVCPSAYDWANDSRNPWSWQKARENFYKGLTLITKTDREKALADSFSAIGHVMHLVEDMSVPAHTRGDLHAIFPFSLMFGVGKDNYETYTDNPQNSLNYTPIPFPYWNESTVTGAPKQLWDMDSYDGQVIYGSDRIGLAEYSNANFFSDGTIFDDFTFPTWTSVVEYDEVVDVAAGKERTYLKKTGDGENINHLAAGRWYYKYLPSSLKRFGLTLDGKVCADYAEKLIPRAVGYSTGLLNYFFRGGMDMVADTAAGSGYVIVNNTDEDMSGKFELYYDDISDQRRSVNPDGWTLDISRKSSGNNKSANIFFNPPTGAKEPGKYILVFRGRMGNEDNAVAATTIYPLENRGVAYAAEFTDDQGNVTQGYLKVRKGTMTPELAIDSALCTVHTSRENGFMKNADGTFDMYANGQYAPIANVEDHRGAYTSTHFNCGPAYYPFFDAQGDMKTGPDYYINYRVAYIPSFGNILRQWTNSEKVGKSYNDSGWYCEYNAGNNHLHGRAETITFGSGSLALHGAQYNANFNYFTQGYATHNGSTAWVERIVDHSTNQTTSITPDIDDGSLGCTTGRLASNITNGDSIQNETYQLIINGEVKASYPSTGERHSAEYRVPYANPPVYEYTSTETSRGEYILGISQNYIDYPDGSYVDSGGYGRTNSFFNVVDRNAGWSNDVVAESILHTHQLADLGAKGPHNYTLWKGAFYAALDDGIFASARYDEKTTTGEVPYLALEHNKPVIKGKVTYKIDNSFPVLYYITYQK